MRRGLRVLLLCCLSVLICTSPAAATDLESYIDPQAVEDALPGEARELLSDTALDTDLDFAAAISRLWQRAVDAAKADLRGALGGTARILAAALFCAVAAACSTRMQPMVRVAGTLAVVALTMGDLHTLLGLGSTMMTDLAAFGKVLMPVLAAASVASGSLTASGTVYLAVMFVIDLLVSLFAELMIPLVWADAALLTAGSITENHGLTKLARALKNGVTLSLKLILGVFTGYLMVAGVISGTADALTVKTVRLAVSSMIPVAGGFLADAAEAVVAGAGIVRSVTGIFGILGVLATAILPFLRLGMQYLAYRGAALLSVVAGADELEPILEGMGEVFSLMLALVGTASALLLIGIFAAAAGVRV
ncbi:MAG: hypothetical protein E7458_00420 [Ruminococcaceae bacterium]|nr:hypothetical protein [Oscillospiraceae bacterium]